jgi:hypothetical protein
MSHQNSTSDLRVQKPKGLTKRSVSTSNLEKPTLPVPSTKEVRLSKLNQVFELNRERLIRIFTYYCSFGEPLNTNKMRSSKFIKFLRDSLLLIADDSPVKKGKGPYGDNSASLRRP